MTMDIASHLGAVARVVEDRDHEGQPARVVIATRTYDTTMTDLWDALTNPERVARWFLPVDGELKLGGRYKFRGNAGGTVTACDPPRSLSATWEMGPMVSWINLTLAPSRGGGALLKLEHIAPVSDHWKQFGPGAVGIGWEMGLMGLGMHIANAASRDAFDANAWGVSADGKAFVRASGEGWITAEIASGVDAADATKRGKATIGFYLGEPPEGVAHPGAGSGGEG